MEILELDDHPYFVATQYHPEYLSRPLKPSPPFFGLILASVGKLHSYLARGCRLTPRQLSDVESGNQLNVNSFLLEMDGACNWSSWKQNAKWISLFVTSCDRFTFLSFIHLTWMKESTCEYLVLVRQESAYSLYTRCMMRVYFCSVYDIIKLERCMLVRSKLMGETVLRNLNMSKALYMICFRWWYSRNNIQWNPNRWKDQNCR